MTKNFRHIAVIPAREGSVGLPQKNQIFFDITANFLDHISWIDEIIVNSNDSVVLDKARSRNYTIYDRPEILSGPEVSIKSVFTDLVNSKNIKKDEIIWLFYLPGSEVTRIRGYQAGTQLAKNVEVFEKNQLFTQNYRNSIAVRINSCFLKNLNFFSRCIPAW